jgi:hypothetical protein
MDLSETNEWQDTVKTVRDALTARLGDHPCLRCKHNNFMLRLFNDHDLKTGLGDARIAELICENCGFIERHSVGVLFLDEKLIKGS